jgi:hypothetical protein
MPREYYKERPTYSFMNERNREIFRLYTEEGMGVKDIGYKFKLSQGRISNIIIKMRHALKEAERLKSPNTEFEKIEALFYPNSLIINALKHEEVNTFSDLKSLMDSVDNHRYGIPRIGERSLRKIREVLKMLESA